MAFKSVSRLINWLLGISPASEY